MPNPKTIKEIESEFEKTLGGLIKHKHFVDREAYEETKEFIKESLLSLLDEVEQLLPEEVEVDLDGGWEDKVNMGKNEYRQQVVNILSELRSGK